MTLTETGKASKLQAFDDLITFTDRSGKYTPEAEELTTDSLRTLLGGAQLAIQKTNNSLVLCNEARNKRNVAMQPLDNVARSIRDYAIAMSYPDDVITQLKSLAASITGTRKQSQQGVDARIGHFEQMIGVVGNIKNYNPSNADIQLTALQALLEAIKAAVRDFKKCESNLRLIRQEEAEIFKGEGGLVGITKRVKIYFKSLLGISAPQYKELIKITRVIGR